LSATLRIDDTEELVRVLPTVRIFQDNVVETQNLARDFEQGVDSRRPRMTVEAELGAERCDAMLASLRGSPSLKPVVRLVELQRTKRVPTRSLIAMSSLCRWIDEAKGSRLNAPGWMCAALMIWDRGKFRVDAADAAEQIADHVRNGGAWLDGTVVSGSFTNRLYTQWIGHNLLTRPLHAVAVGEGESDDERVDLKEIIRAHVGNDALVNRVLDNAKASSTPGLVEFVATRSRSIAVLSKIASRSELYSGAANTNVPKALLLNPTKIPLALLRKFFKPSFFSDRDMKHLVDGASDMRHEVALEIRHYLESKR
jgi:hypothetical protein